MSCAPMEDSDQTVHVFVLEMSQITHRNIESVYRDHLSDLVDAHSDLSLHRAH